MIHRRQFLGAAAAALPLRGTFRDPRGAARRSSRSSSTICSVRRRRPRPRCSSRGRERVMDDSGGRVKIEIYPVDVARRHAAAALQPGARRRRRHRLDGERLHGRSSSRARRCSSCRPSTPTTSIATNLAMREMFDEYLAEEYRDVHVLFDARACRPGHPDGRHAGPHARRSRRQEDARSGADGHRDHRAARRHAGAACRCPTSRRRSSTTPSTARSSPGRSSRR